MNPLLEKATVPQPADVLSAMRALVTERGFGGGNAPYLVEGGRE